MNSIDKNSNNSLHQSKSAVYEKAYSFALEIIKVHKFLVGEKIEFTLSKQLLRSGTSIGANIAEANGGISKADFSNKISIAYKEALETKYWISLLSDSKFLDSNVAAGLMNNLDELCRMLFSILKTTRINVQ